jgi:hypothetical protein
MQTPRLRAGIRRKLTLINEAIMPCPSIDFGVTMEIDYDLDCGYARLAV